MDSFFKKSNTSKAGSADKKTQKHPVFLIPGALFPVSANRSVRPGVLAGSPGRCRGSQPFSGEEAVCLTEASFCEEQVAVERLTLLLSSRTILEVKKINTKTQAD